MSGEVVTLFLLFNSDDDTMLLTFEVFPCLIICFFSLCKSLILIVKRTDVCHVVQELEDMWPKTKIASINIIARDNLVSAKRYYKIYLFWTLNVGNVYNLMTIVAILHNVAMTRFFGYSYKWNENLSQPYAVWYPYNDVGSVWAFIPTYLSQCHGGKGV